MNTSIKDKVSPNLDKVIEGADHLVLLDLSWHLYRTFYTYQRMSVNKNGLLIPTGHFYGILNTIKVIKESYPRASIILCQDGIPIRRQQLLKDRDIQYKADRPDLEYDFFKDIVPITTLAMKYNKVYLAYNEDQESDDLMYALAKQACLINPDIKVFVYSGDDDLLQSITDRISVVRTHVKGVFNIIDNDFIKTDKRMLEKFKGTDSYHLPFYRAIVGDKSDKIQGIYRFPRAEAHRIAMSSNSIEDVLTHLKYKGYLDSQSQELVRVNYDIMKLPDDLKVNIIKRVAPENQLREIADYYQLKSYIKHIWGD